MEKDDTYDDDSGRPETFSEALLVISDWLTLADKLVEKLASAKGEEFVAGTNIQKDLAAWSEWFKNHPEVDQELMNLPELSDGS